MRRRTLVLAIVVGCCLVAATAYVFLSDRSQAVAAHQAPPRPVKPPLLPYQHSLKELDGIDLKEDSALDRIEKFLADERHPLEAKLVAFTLLEVPARQHGKPRAVEILKFYAGGEATAVPDNLRRGALGSLCSLAVGGLDSARHAVEGLFQGLSSALRLHVFEIFVAKGKPENCAFLEGMIRSANLDDQEIVQLRSRIDRLRTKPQ